MKLTNAYFVVVYSAKNCSIFSLPEVDESIFSSLPIQDLPPNLTQLESVQKNILFNNVLSKNDDSDGKAFNGHTFNDKDKVVVVVPDSWISVSKHRIEHIIPTELAPLAALSYAVETIFSAPETLMFNYQQVVSEEELTELTVFACSSEWATQLCLPFQALGVSCLLMSQTQWLGVSARKRSWSRLRKHALSIYQPNREKHKRAKRLWLILALFSLLFHSGAYLYFLTLHQQVETAVNARQEILTLTSEWDSDQVSVPFVESTIALVQALPTSVRLVQFDVDFDLAVVQVTLPQNSLIQLIDRWREEHSTLRFIWDPVSHDEFTGFNKEEVMDVSISIFKD